MVEGAPGRRSNAAGRLAAVVLIAYALLLALGTAAEWGHWMAILRWPVFR